MKRWMARSLFWPTLMHNFVLGRVLRVRHWWDRVDEHLILGALPFKRDAATLQRQGVTGVINMCEEYPGPTARYKQLGIEQLWLPTVDFNHPSEEFVESGAAFIERHAKSGGSRLCSLQSWSSSQRDDCALVACSLSQHDSRSGSAKAARRAPSRQSSRLPKTRHSATLQTAFNEQAGVALSHSLSR